MSDRITTFEAAIEEMLRWANGEKSHWNAYAANIREASPEVLATVTTQCHEADATEVQKWAAVAKALRDLPCGNRDFSPGLACNLPAGHDGDHQNVDPQGAIGWHNRAARH